ncbi:MAG: ATP-binding cassette domain-containing protein [Armatimonadetes bacterium]|nr:ATP-binding cassette domain-containing protein [Armatimonadota bacterium]
MLELKSLSKRFGKFCLSKIDLTVDSGHYFVLLGPSGVGKTMLIELISGLTKPDRGRVLWRDCDITRVPPERRGFAVVYQDSALFPHMTTAGNIAYGMKSRKPSAVGLEQTARMLGIEHLLDRYPETLSGGEQQRVGLARALATDPELLLLDEPLSALDLRSRREFRNLLKRIHSETGKTFLHVTHDLDEATSLGDRIGVMLNGSIRQTGTPEELFRSPSDPDVADFLGMRNVIAVSETKDGICKANGVEIHAAAADESISHIWIKPEEIVLSRAAFDSSARNQIRCRVEGWESSGPLLAVRVSAGDLTMSALITYASFKELAIEVGAELYATFKSSAVHCF